jgi:lysine biosynthesis protein LysW
MSKAYCPNCDAVVVSDNPRVGAVIDCRECGMGLEVISAAPFEVDFPLDYEADWDEDDEDDDDDW